MRVSWNARTTRIYDKHEFTTQKERSIRVKVMVGVRDWMKSEVEVGEIIYGTWLKADLNWKLQTSNSQPKSLR